MADITAILKNPVLYEDALIENEKEKFSWHTHADDIRSSQVFCLSAFGSLRRYKEKDEIINTLFGSCFKDMAPEKWIIEPEANDRKLLGESGTSLQVLICCLHRKSQLFVWNPSISKMRSQVLEDVASIKRIAMVFTALVPMQNVGPMLGAGLKTGMGKGLPGCT